MTKDVGNRQGADSGSKVGVDMIRFGKDLEPIVRLMENTPRHRCIPALSEQVDKGLTRDQFLAALFLTTVRKSNSHHETFAVNAAYQLSLDSRKESEFLPLYWALDSFKKAQELYPAPPYAAFFWQDSTNRGGAARVSRCNEGLGLRKSRSKYDCTDTEPWWRADDAASITVWFS